MRQQTDECRSGRRVFVTRRIPDAGLDLLIEADCDVSVYQRDEEKGVIAWRIKSRNLETDLNLLAPITTKPWGTGIPQLKDEAAPTQEARDSQLLFNEPKYIRMDEDDIHTLESAGLKMKSGVYY